MKLLLDTPSFLWALHAPNLLSASGRTALQAPANSVHVSVVTFWEISLKAGLGKPPLAIVTVPHAGIFQKPWGRGGTRGALARKTARAVEALARGKDADNGAGSFQVRPTHPRPICHPIRLGIGPGTS